MPPNRPSDPSIVAAAAMDTAMGGRPAHAAALLAPAVELDPRNYELNDLFIACLLEAGQHLRALAVLDSLEESGVPLPRSGYFRAMALVGLERPHDALPWSRGAAAEMPDNPRVALVRAQAELASGHLDDARQAVDEAVRAAPEWSATHLARADLALREERMDDALVSYRRAAALEPFDDDVQVGLARLLLHTGHREEAQRILVHVLSRSPNHEQAAEWLSISREVVRPGIPRKIMTMVSLSPLAGAAVGAALAAASNAPLRTGLWGGALAGLAVAWITLAAMRVRRQVSGVRYWVRHVDQQKRRRSTTAFVDTLPWLLAASLVVGILSAFGVGPAPDARIGAVMGVSTFIILAVVFGFRAHRRHSGMPPPEPPPFDPSVCHCPVLLSVGPENAALYATRHLESTGRSLVQGVGILRCPVTDAPWLWFSEDTPNLRAGVPCLVRVRPESLDPPEPERPGVYL